MLRHSFQEEDVEHLVLGEGPPGALGSRPATYTPAGTYAGLVTPLGAEAALKLGLTTVAERCRIRLPAGTLVVPGDQLRARGRLWTADQVSVRVGYTRVIAEAAP